MKYLLITIIAGVVIGTWYLWPASEELSLGGDLGDIQAGLVAHWTLDSRDVNWATGVVLDRSGQFNQSYVAGLSTTTVPTVGKIHQAFHFDGAASTGHVRVTTSWSAPSSMTYAAWIYTKSYGVSDLGRIVHKKNNASGVPSFLVCNNGGAGILCTTALRFEYSWTTTNGAWNANSSILLNQWMHVAVTYSNSATTNDPVLYINGAPVTVTEVITPVGSPAADDNFLILGNRADLTRSFDGDIDDIRIYNRILSADEVRDLYRWGLSTMNY